MPPTDGDQTITGYTVVPDDETSGATGPAQSVPASDLSAVVSGLSSGDTYTFAVSGVNLIGTGLPTVSNAVTIPATTPVTTPSTTTTTLTATPTTLTPTPTTISTTTTSSTTTTTPLKPFPHSNVSYPNGAIIFFGSTGYVLAGGRAFGVPSLKVLAAVQKVDPAKVLAAPAGASLPSSATPRSGVLVFTSPVNGNPEIYVVGADGELHGFAAPRQLKADGYDAALIVTVPNLGGLEVGSAAGTTLTALATKADGAIVNSSGTFFTFGGGRAFGIPTPAELTRIQKANPAAVLTGAVTSPAITTAVASGVFSAPPHRGPPPPRWPPPPPQRCPPCQPPPSREGRPAHLPNPPTARHSGHPDSNSPAPPLPRGRPPSETAPAHARPRQNAPLRVM